MAYIVNKGYEYDVETKVKLTNVVRGRTELDKDIALMEMDRVIANIEGVTDVKEGAWSIEDGIATAKYKVVVHVTAHDDDEAFENAQGEFESEDYPDGMTLVDATPFDYEWYADTQYLIVGD